MEETIMLKAGIGSDVVPSPPKSRRNPQEVRSLLFDLVNKYGINLPNWGNYSEILAEAGLVREDVTEQIFAWVKRAMIQKIKDHVASRPVSSLPPGTKFKMPEGGSIVGGRLLDVGEGDVKVEVDRDGGRRTTEHWSLEAPVIPQGAREDDDMNSVSSKLTSNDGKRAMNVTEANARGLMKAVGQAGADDWSVKKLTSNINDLDSAIEDGASEPSDPDLSKLFHEVLEAIKAGDDVEIVEEGAAVEEEGKSEKEEKAETEKEADEEPKVSKPKKAEKPKKAAKEPKASVNGHVAGAGVDAFGCRIGTNRAKANIVLARAKHPVTMPELIEKGGLSGTVSTHVADLKESGFLHKIDKGYELTAKGRKKWEG